MLKMITCSPVDEYFKIEDLRRHNITEPANKEKTIAQHENLRHEIEKSGVHVLNVGELKDHPNSVFTRDTSFCTSEGYVRLRMGLESRQGEEEWMAEILSSLGKKCMGTVRAPGTVEGGDLIFAGSVIFIGHSSRTNDEGIRQISKILSQIGYEVRATNVPKPYLHLGGMMTVVDDNQILCCHQNFPEEFFDEFNTIEIPAENFISGNVIPLGNKNIIAELSNDAAIAALKSKGFKVHTLDLSEFVKGTGGPSCLVLPS